MKTIGIIGGIGPQATMDLEAKLHYFSQKYIKPDKNGGYPEIITYFIREAPIKVDAEGKPVEPNIPSDKFLEAARIVGKSSDFIIISSNSPHRFQKEVEDASGKKVLSMVKTVVDEIKRRGLKKIGIMGIGGSLKNNLYQEPLAEAGIQFEVIPEEMREKLDQGIFKVMEGREGDPERKIAEEGAEYLRSKNVEAIIMGCTEIPFLLRNQIDRKDLISPIDILAEAAVKFAIE